MADTDIFKKRPSGMELHHAQLKLSADRKKKLILQLLAQTGSPIVACQRLGIATESFYRYKKEDADFAQAVAETMEEVGDMLEAVALDRAVNGVDKPVYYKGEVVGHVTEYSDGLLEKLLKAAKPEKYRENVNVSGGAGTKTGVVLIPVVAVSMEDWEKSALDVHKKQQLMKYEENGGIVDAEFTEVTPVKTLGRG